jgi:hypothetical protein
MLSTILVIGAVLVGLLLLLVLIVSLSARPTTRAQSKAVPAPRTWVNDAGRAHPDAWSPMTSTTTSEIQAIR